MILSFVLPTYNMEAYLGRCLDSLLEQDIELNSYEIIVVNDGSKDNTLTIAKSYQKKYANIIILDQPNGGIGAARNAGLKVSKGEYIYCVDPDDYIAPNVLGCLLKVILQYELEVLAFDYKDLPMDVLSVENKPARLPEKVKVQTGIDFIGEQNFTNECWWLIVKKSHLEAYKIDFMEDRLMEDVVYTQQVLLNAHRFAYIPVDVYRYMTLPNSVRTSKEPAHYRKFIFDCEYTVFLMSTFIADKNLKKINTNSYTRFKSKQQSLVFFIILRLAKSDISFGYLKQMLNRFKKVDAFPFSYFPGKDFKGFSYSLIAIVLNRSWLRYFFLRLLRFVERLKYTLQTKQLANL